MTGSREVPVLTAPGGVTLRPWRNDAADVAVVLRAAAEPSIAHYSPSIANVDGDAGAKRWLADRELASRMEWAVEQTVGNVVGRVCLCAIDDESAVADVGYWLLADARGKGLATIVVNAVAAWAFDDGGFGRLAIEHELDNVASCQVAERCGFAFEALKRGAIVVRGGRHDVHVHARLATD